MANPTEGLGARLQQKATARSAGRKKESATLLGEPVEVRSIMVSEKHALIDEAFTRKGRSLEPVLSKLVPSLLHKAIYDPATGQQAFGSPAAVSAFLDAIPDGDDEAEEVQKLVDLAMKISGLSGEADKEAAKNSGASDA